MAEASAMTKIELTLRNASLFISDLEDVAARWSTWNEDFQLDFTLEWKGVMDHLFYVRDRVAAGAATPEQTAAYRQIQADLRAAAPILHALELNVPPELLQELVPPTERRVSA